MSNQELQRRAEDYAQKQDLRLMQSAGSGVNGAVWYTNRGSVIKVFEQLEHYERERDIYLKLSALNIAVIKEFSVPRLLRIDENLWILELGTVQPPFVLDFAGAYLNNPPDFPLEALEEQEAKNKELFGTKWPQVRRMLAALRGLGIYYVDINRGNIRFPEFDEETADDK